MYATPEGLRGAPTTEMLREALEKMDSGSAAEKARRKGKF
jgi:hypothetical protein